VTCESPQMVSSKIEAERGGREIVIENYFSPDELKGDRTGEKVGRSNIGQIQPKKGLPLERKRCWGVISNQVISFSPVSYLAFSHNRLETAKDILAGRIGL
jgi:hypothetical protein